MTQTTTRPSARSKTAARKAALTIPRVFSDPDVHPYDQVTWQARDIVQTNWKTGETIFEQHGVMFPDFWSVNASTIAATKYFRGAVGTPARESDLRQLIDRVVRTYRNAGIDHGYFATEKDALVFSDELTWLLLNQHFAFNSPVWFNVGTTSPQQVSACFILSVDDSMDSILNWYREEGFIFKGGSGAGVNLSKIRSSKELLSSGGTASGPVSFMRGADASAGTIKSGGATRRAAKMVVLDVDHPDIREFVATKAHEELKIRALRDAGFDMDLDGKDIISVQYQNANNSVRVSDEFMQAVVDGGEFALRGRRDGRVIETVDAKGLFRDIAQAAWECADPGLQYSDTISRWHTLPETGPITASNPCSEFLSIDNSSCNLASINLIKFLNADNTFAIERFVSAVELIITAMDISITFGDFPTETIAENTRAYRQLGIGYANLGALLMSSGLAYDSDEGRSLAAAITSLMSAAAYRQSAVLSNALGAYKDWDRNCAAHLNVLKRHANASRMFDNCAQSQVAHQVNDRSYDLWTTASSMADVVGLRNSQISLLAPTGTIGFLMDVDTTGVEPDFSLVKFKKLVGGGSMQIVNNTVTNALGTLGYTDEQCQQIVDFIAANGHVVGAPHLKAAHYPVFDCAVGERSISAMGHVKMMAAVQPFLSGAISKTVNLPHEATVEEIEEIYLNAWKLGVKALAVYRDGCKAGQPLSSSSSNDSKTAQTPVQEPATTPAPQVIYKPKRTRLPRVRDSRTTSFEVGGADGYMTAGQYVDGQLGEVFLKFGKQGSTLAGVMDAFSIAVSVALQYGVPLDTFVQKFTNQRFEPAGMTNDPDIRIAQSPMDYIFRRLALDFMPFEERAELGIHTAAERARYVETGTYQPSEEECAELSADDLRASTHPTKVVTTPPAHDAVHSSADLVEKMTGRGSDAPICMTCGTKMRPAGSCYACEGCGSTSGCS